MKKQVLFRKMTSWLLLGALLLTSGCGKGAAENGGQENGSGNSGTAVMGRYVEQEMTLPEGVSLQQDGSGLAFTVMEDGALGLLDKATGIWRSSDQGQTWENQEVPALAELSAENYISGLTLGPDGSIGAVYVPLIEDENDYTTLYFYQDGEGNEYTVPYEEEGDGGLHQLWAGPNGSLYGASYDGSVYELDCKAGTAKQIFENDGFADSICFTENYLVLFSTRGGSVYNLTEGMLIEDQVLTDFVNSHMSDSVSADAHAVVAAPAEGDTFYLAMSDGVYRHTVGGSSIEQLMDGSLNSLGNPSMLLLGMTALADESFLILYQGPQLMNYVYDPNMAATPEEEIRVYSLYENYTMRQAVSLYQKEHPDVYVNYEVGITGEDGMTEEDAIKNLNTQLASGDGPDLLVLDGLPQTSYKEKGLLAELTELEAGFTGENSLFPNLVEAMASGDGLYSLPVRFSIPVVAGDAEALGGISDLAALADQVEALRSKNPSGGILGLLTEQDVIEGLMLSSSGAWLDENGKLDEAALTEFLTQAKRIYEAELAGYSEEELSMLREMVHNEVSSFVSSGDSASLASMEALDIAMGNQKLGVGLISGVQTDFNLLATLCDQQEGMDYSLMPGQAGGSFIPKGTVGILAASYENAQVQDFFRYLFDRAFQDLELPDGFPVNQASFEALAQNQSTDEYTTVGSFMIMGDGGDEESFSVEIMPASEAQTARLLELAEFLSAVGTGEARIEQTVIECGAKALNGSASVEDAVAEIVKEAALYLAE